MRKDLLAALITTMTIAIIFLVSVYGVGNLQRLTADFRGETGQIEKTKANSNYRIASYEKFYNKCASVESLESKINNMQDELETVEEDTQRKTILNSSITASKNKRAELIASYNADARKEATQGQFRDSDLPYKLNEEDITSCESY